MLTIQNNLWQTLKMIGWRKNNRWFALLPLFGFNEKDMEEIWDEQTYLEQIEDEYKKNELPKARQSIKEFKQEMQNDLKPELIEYCEKKIDTIKIKLIEEIKYYEGQFKKDTPYWFRTLSGDRIEIRRILFDKWTMQKRILEFKGEIKQGLITEREIAMAKEFDIMKFIEAKNLWALCPFHADKNPSLFLKKNFYYCFVCQATGDTISLVMKLNGLKFIEAVKYILGI